jgi:murein DD-endopeptidase MepM/ murein hydrolase activator NlpD
MSANPVSDLAVQGPSLGSPRIDADRQALKQLAQEFEALLMTQMLREMRRSMLDEEDQESGFGAGPLGDTVDVELGRTLSRVGGFGLTDGLLKAFERQIVAPGSSSTAPEKPAEGNADPASAGPITAPAPISSAFGWRQDPISGAARFHQGVDIAVAYGRDVRAAGSGTVVFSGTQNGYGNTVVIEHGSGRTTRYAHLSEQFVQAGNVVSAGQVVGRSGDSGRATGPHLHFEMLVDGRPVDPIGTVLHSE